jgi:hypothetical protein
VAAADRADSAAERCAVALLRADRRVGVAHGGRQVPSGPAQGERAGQSRWDLLRFTWHDLTNRPGYVVAEILAALAARDDR